jgi:hypothetical protein
MRDERRRVWANFYPDGRVGIGHKSKKDAEQAKTCHSLELDSKVETVALIEVLRGDVTLNAEERRTVATVIHWMNDVGVELKRFRVSIPPELLKKLKVKE